VDLDSTAIEEGIISEIYFVEADRQIMAVNNIHLSRQYNSGIEHLNESIFAISNEQASQPLIHIDHNF
jgi:hypothetical protein